MSNKILSLILLFFIFGISVGGYVYFFVLNKGSLILEGNVEGYKVQLYNKDIKTTFETYCENSKCELIDLAPLTYKISILKEEYEVFSQDIRIDKKSQKQLKFALEKQIRFEKVEQNISSQNENTISQLQQLAQMRQKYKYFDGGQQGYFYIEEEQYNTLALYHWQDNRKKIYQFERIPPRDIQLFFVYGTQDLVLRLENQNILIETHTGKSEVLDFKQSFDYVKKDGNILMFVNEKGTFLYDQKRNFFDFFYLFKDFVYFDRDHYVGIIFADESQKKKNFNYQDIPGNILIKYNHKTQERKIIHTTNTKIIQMIKNQEGIFIYDETQTQFKIMNVE